jgi:hypothetical protein
MNYPNEVLNQNFQRGQARKHLHLVLFSHMSSPLLHGLAADWEPCWKRLPPLALVRLRFCRLPCG